MKKLLKSLKWLLLPVTLIVLLMFIEAATDSSGISADEEGLMYGAWSLVIANAGLFVFNRKWCELVDRML